MTPEEYAALDATAIAAAVTAGDVTAAEVRAAASTMHERTHQTIHAILEWYDEPSIGSPTGALAGVPFLRKDHGSSEAGRLQEMGSRLTVGHRTTSTSRSLMPSIRLRTHPSGESGESKPFRVSSVSQDTLITPPALITKSGA